jgi:hypothetical protein
MTLPIWKLGLRKTGRLWKRELELGITQLLIYTRRILLATPDMRVASLATLTILASLVTPDTQAVLILVTQATFVILDTLIQVSQASLQVQIPWGSTALALP